MNQITPRQDRVSEGREPTIRLPDYAMQFMKAESIVINLGRARGYVDTYHLKAALTEAHTLLSQNDFEAIGDDLRARSRPATRAEAAQYLSLLIGSFPSARIPNPEVFGKLLVEEVLAGTPSIGAVIEGTSRVRRKSKFMPSIAEILKAIEWADTELSMHLGVLEQLPVRIDEGRQLLARREEEERRSRAREEERQRREEEARQRRKADHDRWLAELQEERTREAAARPSVPDVLGDEPAPPHPEAAA
jgi:hypothetical protein